LKDYKTRHNWQQEENAGGMPAIVAGFILLSSEKIARKCA
jgi:hypothetical protein